ncbi:hypothetical protein [Paenibacillus sp. HJGM_3]|uniref:hypothetical protein n=1 Tax=Paenibacillus sp. HJGM_3 TaxID=3379816 RepID=UPI00385FCB27
MPRTKTAHVLKFADARYFIEEAPFAVASLEEAEIYYKYFDLLEAQQRAVRHTGENPAIMRITFTVADIAESPTG